MLEGEEEYRREESGRKEFGNRYWNDEDVDLMYGNDRDFESGYEMHEMIYDREMQTLDDCLNRGNFDGAEHILKHYKDVENIISVLKNVIVNYVFVSKDQYESFIAGLSDFLNQNKISKKKKLNFSIAKFLNSPELEELICDRWNEDYYDDSGNDDYYDDNENENATIASVIKNLNIPAAKKEKIALKVVKEQLIKGNIPYTRKLKEDFPVHSKDFDFNEVEDAALKGLINFLSENNLRSIDRIIKYSIISPEKLASPDVIQAALTGLINCLSAGYIDCAINIKDYFALPPEKLEQAAENCLTKHLLNNNIYYAIEIKDNFIISPEKLASPEIEQAILNNLVKNLLEGNIDTAIKIKDSFAISAEKLATPELEQAALSGLIKCLSEGYVDTAIKIKNNFTISPEKLEQAALSGLIDDLSRGYIDRAFKIKDSFAISAEKLATPELEQAALSGLIKCLSEGHINNAIEIKNDFTISPEKLEQAALTGLARQLSKGNIETVMSIKNNFLISPEKLATPGIEKAALQAIISQLLEGYINDAIKIKDNFTISPEKLEQAAITFLCDHLSKGHIDYAIKIKDNFTISPEKIQEADQPALSAIINELQKSCVSNAIKIKDKFKISPEKLATPKVEKAALQDLTAQLLAGYIKDAIHIKNNFPVSPEKLEQAALTGLIKQLSKGRISDASTIKDNFPVSPEKLDSPEVERAALTGLISELSNDHVDRAVKIKNCFPISPEKLDLAAIAEITNKLSTGHIDYAIQIKDNFMISPKKIATPEIEQAALTGLIRQLSNGYIEHAVRYKNNFTIAPENLEQTALTSLIGHLSNGKLGYAIDIKKDFTLSPEKLASPEVEQAALTSLADCLRDGQIENAFKISENFPISPEKLEQAALAGFKHQLSINRITNAFLIKKNFTIAPEKIEQAALAGLINGLSEGDTFNTSKIKDSFTIAPEKLASPEVEQAALAGLTKSLQECRVNDAIKIKDDFTIEKIASPEVEQAALAGLIKSLLDSCVHGAIMIKDNFSLSPEKLVSPEVAHTALASLINCLRGDHIHDAIMIKKNFSLSPENLEQAALTMFIHHLSEGHADSVIQIKHNFPISSENLSSLETEQAALKGLTILLSYGDINKAVMIKDHFAISPEKLEYAALKGLIGRLSEGHINDARKIGNIFNVLTEEKIRNAFLNPSPQNRKLIEFFGAITSEEERKKMSQELGIKMEALLYNGYAKYNKISSRNERNDLIQNFTRKISESIESGSDTKTFNKLVSIIKELDNQRNNDEQSTADFLFEVSKNISGKLDDKQFLILVRKLSEIKDQKANFFALRLAGQSRVKPLAFARSMQKLSDNGFVPKAITKFIVEEKEEKKQPSQEKIAVLQKIISEYPNQFSTIISTLSDPRFADFDLAEEKELVFSSLKDFKAVTPIIFERYRNAGEEGRKKLVEKINRIKPILFKNQSIKNILSGQDQEIFTEMIYIAYSPVGMSFQEVENLLEQVEDRTQDLAKFKFPEDGYDFSFNDKTRYRVKPGEMINPQVLDKVSGIFSGTYPKNEDEIKKISSVVAKLAKGGTDLKDSEITALLSLLSEEGQIKDFKSKTAKNKANIRLFLGEAKENLGVFFNDNFPRLLEQFLSANPQSKEKIEAILAHPERVDFIKNKIEKQIKDKNLQIDWNDPSQIVSAYFSLSCLKKIKQEISKETKKYELAPEGEGERSKLTDSSFRAYISKNVGSFFAKASAGICTAQDVSLFNRKEHFHINIVENSETVQANIQAYIINYPPDKKSLFLRGFNPNTKFMKNISIPVFCDKVIEVAKKFQRDNGLSGVYLSEQLGSWHALSNRSEVAAYLSRYLKSDNQKDFSYAITSAQRISKMYEV
ncbi:hypothetical protein A2303_03120 [Candidatus Falkowbacteria bacterium RIFOXYB2_FULL_47_14]|uniref:Uncharacterized protein n=1 Tax=Candidatus Falkowbacteria bacterium RIFOXYA2_FULL_47_19 TaxID=1797994 RepID=A0A1F5SFR2_9BACT|nr:MAG: hypothetical protein A2227_07855 [Candidatus Falkowbacteria bacterium RIFOXYA2_FULL_47_19]OGF35180.1 MAG: hypothetical protein A2468_01955 [Candidatus Falkowbacteria bacterium RIFOXYC2_FULL_46_15]OGF43345.1 MAG: hypothetical protein A2303_03120 [Candidatus Falkowbacteria bacterium RIFOXYB2_FULL_47_14]